MKKRVFLFSLCCISADTLIRLLVPINAIYQAPIFYLGTFTSFVCFIFPTYSAVTHHNNRASALVFAFGFLLICAYFVTGGPFKLQSIRRGSWFDGKKATLAQIVDSYKKDRASLNADYRPIGTYAGLDALARTNAGGGLEIMIPVAGQVPRGGFIFIEGIALPPNRGLDLVLVRRLGDGWYEYIVARNDGVHPIDRIKLWRFGRQ